MELRHIEFFIACVENGSLGKAAEKLYTSQPNVSKTIKEFEKELGEGSQFKIKRNENNLLKNKGLMFSVPFI